MVTVVDPGGTPAPVYNRSGTTLQSIAATGTNFAGAAPITAPSGYSVVLITPSANNDGVILPSGAEIGDVVETYPVGGTVNVYAPSGETIAGNASLQLSNPFGTLIRKTSATNWRYIGN